jgi:hypothetical protein
MRKALTPLYTIIGLVGGMLTAPVAEAQTVLKFQQPQLVEGTAGQVGAGYKFTGVIQASNGQPLTDCIVRIESLSDGVEIVEIDQDDQGKPAAFQPVIEHQKTIGAASVSFSFEFVPHDGNDNPNGKYIFPALAASLSGLKGLGDAQAFAECAIGKNGMVMLSQDSRNLLVAKSGEAFRAQYKWGVDPEEDGRDYPVVFANQSVSGFTLKMGVNSKMSPYEGVSVYEVLMTEAMPAGQMNGNIRFASYKAEEVPVPTWFEKEEPVADSTEELSLKNMKLANNLLVFIPEELVGKKVTIDIQNDKGELRRRIIEEKAPTQILVEIGDLAAGSYKILVQSETKKFTILTIRPSQL